MYTLLSDTSKVIIDPQGCRICKLILNETVLLGTFTRIDGKEGNTHICTPNFGKEGEKEYSLPPHGPGRNALWRLAGQTDNSLTLTYDMPKTGSYPTTLSIAQTIILKTNIFEHKLLIANTGRVDAPVNGAIHYYFHTPNGWNTLAINEKNQSDLVQRDESLPFEQNMAIQIPGVLNFTMSGVGFSRLHFWTGRIEKDSTQVFDTNYCCIEPVFGEGTYFGSNESILTPGSSKQAVCTISLSENKE